MKRNIASGLKVGLKQDGTQSGVGFSKVLLLVLSIVV